MLRTCHLFVIELPANSPASVSMLSSSAGGPSPIDTSLLGQEEDPWSAESESAQQNSPAAQDQAGSSRLGDSVLSAAAALPWIACS